MDTAWIQVFILSFTQCVTPAVNEVCELRTVELQFADQRACEAMLAHMPGVAANTDTVLFGNENSHCRAKAMQSRVFASADETMAQHGGTKTSLMLDEAYASSDSTTAARADYLPACDDVAGMAPCRIGPIIVEVTAELDTPETESR